MIDYRLMDCMTGMAEYPDKHFDLAIVDPPYRNDDENAPTKTMRREAHRNTEILGGKPDQAYFNELYRVSKNQIIWGANNFGLPPFKGFVVWRKLTIDECFTLSMAEIASLSDGLGSVSKVFEFMPQGTKNDPRIHPTQKPVALYKWLLTNYAKPGDKILDTHVGSASSLIACHDLGFDAVGFEIDPDYYNESKDRLERHMRQLSFI